MTSSSAKNTSRGRKRNTSPRRKRSQTGGVNKRNKLTIGTYWDPQVSAGCGRHALNNLFGNEYFIKDDNSELTDESFKTLGSNFLSGCKLSSE